MASVEEELRLHAEYSRTQGLDLTKVEPLPATERYTGFLAGVASDPASDAADILAAMAPCMRLYAFLGQRCVPFRGVEGGGSVGGVSLAGGAAGRGHVLVIVLNLRWCGLGDGLVCHHQGCSRKRVGC
jgi:hypothetical protein